MPRPVFWCLLTAATLSGGCAIFKPDQARQQADGQPTVEGPARYVIDVQAPKPLKELLAKNLDLERFRRVPASEGLGPEELDRLIAQVPQEADALLRTEGYFDARTTATRQAVDGGLPRVVVAVEPGPRVLIDTLSLTFQGELRQRAESGDATARQLEQGARDRWSL